MILIPWVGTRESERVLIILSVASALCVLIPFVWRSNAKNARLLLAGATVAGVILAAFVPGVPAEVIAYGRLFKIWADDPSGAKTL